MKLSKFIGVSLWCLAISVFAQGAEQPYEIDYTLLSQDADSYTSKIAIRNNSNQAIYDWTLLFNQPYGINSVAGAEIASQLGDYRAIHCVGSCSIAPHQSVSFEVVSRYVLSHKTDAPSGYMLLTNNGERIYTHIPSHTNLDVLKTQPDLYSLYQDWNQQQQAATTSDINIIPEPVSVERQSGELDLNAIQEIHYEPNQLSAQKGSWLLRHDLQADLHSHLPVRVLPSTAASANSIQFLVEPAPQNLKPFQQDEWYQIKMNSNQIQISAQSYSGFVNAISSLRQLELGSRKLGVISKVNINDYPRFAYRGVLLDSARHFQSIQEVKRLIDLMAVYKLNRFHWHLTDDESWRIEIPEYPELVKVGSARGLNSAAPHSPLALPPSFGTGASYHGYYSLNELRDVVHYAAVRNITIIPEIDLPGHARALIQSLPDQLKDPEDHSQYQSVQGYSDNVISPCLAGTYQVLDTVIGTIAQVFPGDYIHIGSDEVPAGAWDINQNPTCAVWVQQEGIAGDQASIHHRFLQKLQAILQKHGKNMAGYQEVLVNNADQPLNQDTLVVTWINQDSGAAAAEQGYPVVMNVASSLYFDLAYDSDPHEPGYQWAGYTSSYSAYIYQPLSGVAVAAQENIQGVQGSLWAENLISQDRIDYMAFPKLLGLSETAWAQPAQKNWGQFGNKLGQAGFTALGKLGVAYRVPPPGVVLKDGMVLMNTAFPGLTIHYTSEARKPTLADSEYKGPIPVQANMRLAAFDGQGAASNTVYINYPAVCHGSRKLRQIVAVRSRSPADGDGRGNINLRRCSS